jgi:hypothetical protein
MSDEPWFFDYDDEDDLPPGAKVCPYCGHVSGTTQDDGDGCSACRPAMRYEQDEEAEA